MGYSTFGLHKMRGISRLTYDPLVSQEELCYTKLVNVACVGSFFTDISGQHIGPGLMDPQVQDISSRNSKWIRRFSVVDSRVLPSADGPTAQYSSTQSAIC
jgi:hypothetical protein